MTVRTHGEMYEIAEAIFEEIIELQEGKDDPEFVFDSTLYADYGIKIDTVEEDDLELILGEMLGKAYREYNKEKINENVI